MNTTVPKKLGRYQILSEIGRGAMGVVYKAHDPVIERDVAVKAIQLAFQVNAEEKQVYLNRFYREAKAAGKLNHTNIVTIYDVDEDKETGTPFIVMEFLEGTTLQDIVNDGILLPVNDVKSIIMQIADALNYAHKQGVVHRDVKSANIILVEGMRCKIMDFGIARLSTSDLTKSGQFIGTPNYMSPEQIDGKAIVDGRSDLFALGVIFYLLLTGERPFSGDSFTSISYKIVHVDPLPPRVINPAVPEVYNQILARLMAKDPAKRYLSGAELINDLKRIGASTDAEHDKAEALPAEEATVLSEPVIEEGPAKENPPSIASRRTMTIFRSEKIPKPVLFTAVLLMIGALLAVGSMILRSPSEPVSPVTTAPAASSPTQGKVLSPENETVIRSKWNLAVNYAKNGFYDKSIQQLNEILIIDPDDKRARQYLKELLQKKEEEAAKKPQ
jgi:serine/threonine-protein kinase